MDEKMVRCTTCGTEARTESTIKGTFYKSKSEINLLTGYLHNCKTCTHKAYQKYMDKYEDENYCVYLLCRLYDYPYYSSCAKKAVAVYLGKDKKIGDNPFAEYLKQIWLNLKQKKIRAVNFEQCETKFDIQNANKEFDISEELQNKWGRNFVVSEYKFLEDKYNSLAETLIVDEGINALIVQACYTFLEQRKLVESESMDLKRFDELTKKIRELIKDLGLDAKSKVERDNGKLVNSLGMAVAEYEDIDPIDLLGKFNTLKNVNNIEGYLKDYVLRPTLNILCNNREFELTHTEEDENFDYMGKSVENQNNENENTGEEDE